MPAINPTQPIVSSLHFYPIKSCRGFSLQRGEVGKRGFANDRLFLIVDESGRFITQREKPRMALVQPELCGDKLTLSAPDIEPLSIERRQTGAASTVSI